MGPDWKFRMDNYDWTAIPQIWHSSKYPVLENFYFQFEKEYNPFPVQTWMMENKWLPLLSVVCYLLFCFFGSTMMKDRKALGLRRSLAAWNLFLSLFSFYGVSRTLPHLIWNISNKTFEESICDAPGSDWGTGPTGLAVQLFILSKIPELVDTVFIILRKKPLIFLHWYHHFTVLVFCYNSYLTESGAGLHFVAMNYTVHGVMYFYFFLQAVKMMPKWFPSWIITVMQIGQMVVGTIIVGSSIYFIFYGGNVYAAGACNVQVKNLVVGGLIYASYLYLFMEFAVKKFIFPTPKAVTPAKKVE